MLCKNPVILAITVNFITMILFIYSMNQRMFLSILPLMLTGVVNRRILDNGINLNKQKKTIIYLSLFIAMGLLFMYIRYTHGIRESRIINGL